MDTPTILVVEDNDPTQTVISRLFRKKGWTVLCASTVAHATALLRPPPFCAIIDLLLPDGDGTEIIDEIRRESLPIEVIVVTTATSELSRLEHAVSLRPSLLIKKPFDWDVLWRYCDSEWRRRQP